MNKILWLLVFSLFIEAVEGIFFVTPKQTSVIVGKTVFLECKTYNDGYTLTFVSLYVAPPRHSVSSQTLRENLDLRGGGKKTTTTFIVTKELNTTSVKCFAFGTTYEQTNPAAIYSYELPDGIKNSRVCQLGNYTFVTWDPIFALQGIELAFRITDNMGSNHNTSDLYHSFSYTKENYFDYNANVTVIVNATAANQIAYSYSTIFKTLNGTISLIMEYNCTSEGGNWTFFFLTKLDHLNECSINNETLKDVMIVSCNEERQCINNSRNVNITKNEINSMNSLPAKRKYNHTLCFNYLGREIVSQPLQTSTHDIQDIENLSQNDTSLCLRFHLVHHYQIQSIHMHVKRGSELLPFNVTVPNNNNIFKWCANTIPPTSSNNNGNWSLFACDGPGYICTNPAIVLENIVLNINETATTLNVIASTATTHTIATYTTHTTTTSLSHSLYSTPIVYSLSPSPSSTVTTSLPSSTVNLIVPVTVAVLFVVFIGLIILAVIVVVCAKFRNKKGQTTVEYPNNHTAM